MQRFRVLSTLLRHAARPQCQQALASFAPAAQASSVGSSLQQLFGLQQSYLHSTPASFSAQPEKVAKADRVAIPIDPKDVVKDNEKYSFLMDKDVWDEAWVYDNKFGSETEPIVVPSTLAERIIGVTDPHDDTMVIWGVLKEGEPARQLVAGGEFFVVQRVERVVRVGDLVDK